jgi:hypothetical protein
VGFLNKSGLQEILTALTIVVASGVGFLSPSGRVEIAHGSAETLAVIVSDKSRVSELSMGDLGRIFRGMATRSSDGHRFVPLNQAEGSPARTAFDQAVLGMTPDQARAFWVDQKIRAVGTEPRVVSSVPLAIKLVSVLAGAITYVPRGAVTSGVKAIRIDGKTPEQAGYPIR